MAAGVEGFPDKYARLDVGAVSLPVDHLWFASAEGAKKSSSAVFYCAPAMRLSACVSCLRHENRHGTEPSRPCWPLVAPTPSMFTYSDASKHTRRKRTLRNVMKVNNNMTCRPWPVNVTFF